LKWREGPLALKTGREDVCTQEEENGFLTDEASTKRRRKKYLVIKGKD